jgi:hypothetical protein
MPAAMKPPLTQLPLHSGPEAIGSDAAPAAGKRCYTRRCAAASLCCAVALALGLGLGLGLRTTASAAVAPLQSVAYVQL